MKGGPGMGPPSCFLRVSLLRVHLPIRAVLRLSLRLTCFTVAGIYFVGVRMFGASFYRGSGSRA
jgi:hypothetical protein